MTEAQTIPSQLPELEPKKRLISRDEYYKKGKLLGNHSYAVESSWYFLVNDFVFKMQPASRPNFSKWVPRYRDGLPIHINFHKSPSNDHHWSERELGEVDDLDAESLKRQLELYSDIAQQTGRSIDDIDFIAEIVGRGCRPAAVQVWIGILQEQNHRAINS